MKAQRRHQLQNNELAKVITNAPTFWQDWGGRALVAAIAVLVVVILVRYKISSNREARAQATANLATARSVIEELNQMAMVSPLAPPQEMAVRRRSLFNDGNNAISEAIRQSDDRKIQAEALIAKGDLYWTLAALPPLAGAATQPSLQVKDPKDLLAGAQESYQTVVNNYADDKYALIAARFGIGAIAENNKDFDAAKTQYDKLALEAKDWPAYEQMVSARLSMLEQLRKPVLLAKAATLPAIPPPPTTSIAIPELLRPPTTMTATTAPTTQAAVAVQAAAPKPQATPATQAAITTTAPATQPR